MINWGKKEIKREGEMERENTGGKKKHQSKQAK
jgi:hypothetical protein